MWGFKHQFEVKCLSCAFGVSMPDGRVLSEKLVLRSTNLRVQDYSQKACCDYVRAARYGIRRTCYTGLNTLVNMVAWDLRTASALSQSEHVEEDKQSKCACAVRISSCSRQRRRAFLRVSREMHQVVTKDVNLRDRSRRTKEILNCGEKIDISVSIRMSRSNILVADFTVESVSKQPTTGLDPSRAWCLVSGLVPGHTTMAAASSQDTDTGYPEFHIPEGKKGTAAVVLVWNAPNPS